MVPRGPGSPGSFTPSRPLEVGLVVAVVEAYIAGKEAVGAGSDWLSVRIAWGPGAHCLRRVSCGLNSGSGLT